MFQIWLGSVRGTRRRAVRLGHDRRGHSDATEPDQIIARRTGLHVRKEKRFRWMRFRVMRTLPGPDTWPPVQVPEEIRRRPAQRRVRMTSMGGRPGPVPGAVRHAHVEDPWSSGKENAPSVQRHQIGNWATTLQQVFCRNLVNPCAPHNNLCHNIYIVYPLPRHVS